MPVLCRTNNDVGSGYPDFTSGKAIGNPLDPATDLLDIVALRGSVVARATLLGTWGIAFPAVPDVQLHILTEGRGWLRRPGEDAEMTSGDIVLITDPTSHGLASGLTVDLRPLSDVRAPRMAGAEYHDVRLGETGATTRIFCGRFQLETAGARLLMRGLPPVLVLRARTIDLASLEPLIALVVRECDFPRPGSAAILNRLAEVLFLQVLRAAVVDCPQSGLLLRALEMPGIGSVLAALHRSPDRNWTVAEMASVAGQSRTMFAERFVRTVGQTPLAYLTEWRLTQAAKRLSHGALSLSDIAFQVGYQSEVAFSRAFRRHFGCPPGRYRSSAARGLRSPDTGDNPPA